MSNRLASSSSPYLRQHQNNPVDWFPWCEEAFTKARSEDKPIFLSVGYSACHWCHVMEHESFENEAIAALLNEHFVSIKVDREERPDVDQIYMQAVQMLTGSGGWPMSVFMNADGQPFYGGTYWPPDDRFGRPGFPQVLRAVADAWNTKREQIADQGDQIVAHLQSACRGPDAVDSGLDGAWIVAADQWLQKHHDSKYGGFGTAPKFPHTMDISLMIELCALERQQVDGESQDGASDARHSTIRRTLDGMAQGGIYDHLGGGFARYSVDAQWLVPHFEKMLYDNALLACCYADAYRLWQHSEDAQVVQETLDYVLRDMTDPLGAFYSTEDADSEGVEGKFYVWSRTEIEETLGVERADRFCECYGVTTRGNFEGANILHLPTSLREFAHVKQIDLATLQSELAADRAQLLERRNQRIRPGLDDKVLLSWNALMISALTRGYRALGQQRYLEAAQKSVAFLCDHMRQDSRLFFHTWRHGEASLDAYLDDYSYLIVALTELFEVDCTPEYLQLAIEIAELLLEQFSDPEGGFFFTAKSHEALIARSKDLADSSVPSGNAMAATGLLTLSRLTGRSDFRDAAESALTAASGVMQSAPQAAGQSLRGLLRHLHPSEEFVLVGEIDAEDCAARSQLLKPLRPLTTTVCALPQQAKDVSKLTPLLKDREAAGGETTLYVCRDAVCGQPLRGQPLVDFLSAME